MLELKLRNKFHGTHMPGTATSPRTSDNHGAAQKSPDHILWNKEVYDENQGLPEEGVDY